MCLPQFFTASALRVRLAGSGSAAAAAFRLGLSLAFAFAAAALVFPAAFFALTFAFAVVRIDAPRALGTGGAGPHPPSEARMEAASFPDSRLPCSTCDPRSGLRWSATSEILEGRELGRREEYRIGEGDRTRGRERG